MYSTKYTLEKEGGTQRRRRTVRSLRLQQRIGLPTFDIAGRSHMHKQDPDGVNATPNRGPRQSHEEGLVGPQGPSAWRRPKIGPKRRTQPSAAGHLARDGDGIGGAWWGGGGGGEEGLGQTIAHVDKGREPALRNGQEQTGERIYACRVAPSPPDTAAIWWWKSIFKVVGLLPGCSVRRW